MYLFPPPFYSKCEVFLRGFVDVPVGRFQKVAHSSGFSIARNCHTTHHTWVIRDGKEFKIFFRRNGRKHTDCDH